MRRIISLAALCTLSACASTPSPKPDAVPPQLVPAGFSAADCKVVKPAQADVDEGPGGSKFSHGEHGPQVECKQHSQGAEVVKSTPTCHTKGGKQLPLSDCCMNESGDPIPNCKMKEQPPGE